MVGLIMDGKLTPSDVERFLSALERIATALENSNVRPPSADTEYRSWRDG